ITRAAPGHYHTLGCLQLSLADKSRAEQWSNAKEENTNIVDLECIQCHGIVRRGCAGRQPRCLKQARHEQRTQQKKVVVGAT
ncbi:hypothetical protein ABG768_014004, partial [Culter alburnus]